LPAAYLDVVDGTEVVLLGWLAGGSMKPLPDFEIELAPVEEFDDVAGLEPCDEPAASADVEIAIVMARQPIRYFSKISSKTSSL
jgi:hypothetical protein